jgi:Flp pilus assembly protein TadG
MKHQQTPRLRQRGTTVVEFALIFPLFMTVLFGVIEYGWIFYQRFNIANAVRDGVRQGVTVSQTASPDPRSFAVQKTQVDLAAVGIPQATITLTAQYQGASPTKTMTLTAVMPYHPLLGFVPTPQNLTYQMTMMLELQ